MTKDLLTQAAQKEAEGLYPGCEACNSLGHWHCAHPEQCGHGDWPIQRAAYVKCALLYSERAAGLVEAGKAMAEAASRGAGLLMGEYEDEEAAMKIVRPLNKWYAALHAFNSQT